MTNKSYRYYSFGSHYHIIISACLRQGTELLLNKRKKNNCFFFPDTEVQIPLTNSTELIIGND